MADGSNIGSRASTRKKLVADLWCGAGGTITGAARAARDLGIPLEVVSVIQLAQPQADGFRIDILYRMLNYRELARAMSFDDGEEVYDFAGTSTEITKQIGNAVPCRTAAALFRALMEDA